MIGSEIAKILELFCLLGLEIGPIRAVGTHFRQSVGEIRA